MVTVDIGIACGMAQYTEWWDSLLATILKEQQRGIAIGQIIAIRSALPDHNKNNIVGGSILYKSMEQKKRMERTDINRSTATQSFLSGRKGKDGKSDWLFWIDDDTVIPDGALTDLLRREKKFIAGLYFNPSPPHNPIAYHRNKEDGFYSALYDYPAGSLIPVDSVGMGCTLIHRSVFEAIMDAFELYVRPNGTVFPIHKNKVKRLKRLSNELKANINNSDEILLDGYHIIKVTEPLSDDDRAWPFYSMEYGRTEDHHFCELAAQVGIKPWVDTSITCGHIKAASAEYKHYKEHLNETKGFGAR